MYSVTLTVCASLTEVLIWYQVRLQQWTDVVYFHIMYLPVVGLRHTSVPQLVHQRDPPVLQVGGHRVHPGQPRVVAHLIPAGIRQHVGQIDRSFGLNCGRHKRTQKQVVKR